MVRDDTVGAEVNDSLVCSDGYWLERTPPELEWDESEAALVVEDLVGASRLRDDG